MSQTAEQGGLESQIQQGYLLEFFENIKAVVEECIVSVDESGLHVRAVDPATIVMIETTLSPRSRFEATQHEFGLQLSGLISNRPRREGVLEQFGPGEIGFAYTPDLQQLQLTSGTAAVTMNCPDSDLLRNRPDIPDIDLGARVHIKSDDLRGAIQLVDAVSDHVRFQVDAEEPSFNISATGDISDASVSYPEGRVAIEPGTADSLYSLDYMTEIVEPIPPETTVTIDVGEQMPLRIEYPIADGNGSVLLMQAPRIQGGVS